MLRLLQCGESTLVLAQQIPPTNVPGMAMILTPGTIETWQGYWDYAVS